jgi:hypothetical protein
MSAAHPAHLAITNPRDGIQKVLRSNLPSNGVEVDDAFQTACAARVEDNAYVVEAKYRPYRGNRTYLIAPWANSQSVG